MRITFLGTGTSHGIPVIGCNCRVCTSSNPKNQRTRPSIYVEGNHGEKLIVDTSPELRIQALRNNIVSVDMVLFTHYHADHIVGLDDIRKFNEVRRNSLPCYGNESTLETIRSMFSYALNGHGLWGGIPEITLHLMPPLLRAGHLEIKPVKLLHGSLEILGYTFDQKAAYLTDCSFIPPESMKGLEGVDLLILDALRYRPHPTHFTLDQAIEVASRLKPKRVFFTHICHDLEHDEVNSQLPAEMQLAYDSQVIEV